MGRSLYASSLRGGDSFHVFARLSGIRLEFEQNLIESCPVVRKKIIQPFNDGWLARGAPISGGIFEAQEAAEKLHKPSMGWEVAWGAIFEVQGQRLHGYT